ncbi:MAG: cytochrome P460 family protein [Bacteroidetes bacterium]|nr:cytochrome P460 family protein [Bacteroidota bacterium]
MKKIVLGFSIFALLLSCNSNSNYQVISKVPDLTMPDSGLKFKEIEDYKNYKIVGTHFRTDKNELRYILANEKAFKAFNEGSSFPDGSKIVKIGWNIEKMSNFGLALEAKEVQRVEYMIKDSKKFSQNPGNWGYARFVKKEGNYRSWEEGTASCVACHNLAKDDGFVFTKYQNLQ